MKSTKVPSVLQCTCTMHIAHDDVFQTFSCLPCVSYYFLSPQCIFQRLKGSFAFCGTASSIAGFSFQSEGMTTLTNRSCVYHCAALRTYMYLSQAHTCTSVHVPHFTTNNEVNRTKLSLSLSSPLSSDAIFITCHVQLYVPGAVCRRILEILKKAESSLIDYSYMM